MYEATRFAIATVINPFDVLTERFVLARAQKKAEKKLARALETPDLVACPQCGWYQRDMVHYLRKRRLTTIVKVAALAIPICMIVGYLALSASDNLAALPIVFLGVAAILSTAAVVQAARNPNSCRVEQDRNDRAAASQGVAIGDFGESLLPGTVRRGAGAGQEPPASVGDVSFLNDPDQVLAMHAKVKKADVDRRNRDRDQRRAAFWPILAVGLGAGIGAAIDAILAGKTLDHVAGGIVLGLIGAGIGGFTRPMMLMFYASWSESAEFHRDPSKPRPKSKLPGPESVTSVVALVCASVLASLMAIESSGANVRSCSLVLGCGALLTGIAVWRVRQGKQR